MDIVFINYSQFVDVLINWSKIRNLIRFVWFEWLFVSPILIHGFVSRENVNDMLSTCQPNTLLVTLL